MWEELIHWLGKHIEPFGLLAVGLITQIIAYLLYR